MTLPDNNMHEVDLDDWHVYYNAEPGDSQGTLALREMWAKRYVEELKRWRALSAPPPVDWQSFENYVSQAVSKMPDTTGAITLLLSWSRENPEVKRALDLFVAEALRTHIARCENCGKALVSHPQPSSRKYCDDTCRKRLSRSK